MPWPTISPLFWYPLGPTTPRAWATGVAIDFGEGDRVPLFLFVPSTPIDFPEEFIMPIFVSTSGPAIDFGEGTFL